MHELAVAISLETWKFHHLFVTGGTKEVYFLKKLKYTKHESKLNLIGSKLAISHSRFFNAPENEWTWSLGKP